MNHRAPVNRRALTALGALSAFVAIAACGSAQDETTDTTDTGVNGSPSCTTLTGSVGSIVDGAGVVWTLKPTGTSGSWQVYANGKRAGFSDYVKQLAYVGGVIAQENKSGSWWKWQNNAWVAEGDPTLACFASPDCSTVTDAKGSIVDASGVVWTLRPNGTAGSFKVYANGVPAGFTDYVLELAYVGGVVSQKNQAHAWWSWNQGSWQSESDPTTKCGASSSSSSSSSSSGGGAGGRGPLKPGVVYWGAVGHRDQGGVYDTPLAQQIADLKNVFGDTPNTIVYRAISTDADVRACQQAGVVPLVLTEGYPPFDNFADEKAAYDWAYNDMSGRIAAMPTNTLFEIGNEWTIYQHFGLASINGDPMSPDVWRKSPYYRRMLGVHAGAIAALRDKAPDAAVVGGTTAGWTQLGLPVALGVDLASYSGRDLSWDYTVLHWYNDAGGGNQMGMPDSFAGGKNAFATENAVGKPIAITEFGSSPNSSEQAAGANLQQLMSDFVQHTKSSATEPGVAFATVYELYPNGGEKYKLYYAPGQLAPDGQAVKDWIAQHGNPSP